MQSLKSFIILFLLLIAIPAWSATYYADNDSGNDSNNGASTSTPWKYFPGMTGWSGSTTLSSGDVIILKGGVTWTRPADQATFISIPTSGITIKGGQQLGVPWGTGYPVLDGGLTTTLTVHGIDVLGKTSIVIDGLKIIGMGNTVNGSGYGIFMRYDCSNSEVKNSWLETMAVDAIAVLTDTVSDHVYIHDNHFKSNGRVHVIPSSSGVIDDFRFYNNLYEGPSDYAPLGFHGDGIMIGADNPTTYGITNLKIYNNKFYGNWSTTATAAIYLNGSIGGNKSIQHAQIYNNVVASESNNIGAYSPGAICVRFGAHDDIKIYNNTVALDAFPIGIGIYIGGIPVGGTVDLKNNIISGSDNGVYIDPDVLGTITIDNILFHTVGGNHLIYDGRVPANRYNTCSAAQAAGFVTSYCAIGDPHYVALPSGGVTGSGDWHLTASSTLALGVGANLSATIPDLLTDLEGTARAASPSLWDLGAYTYDAAPTTHDLTVTKSGTGTGTVTSSPVGISCGATCTGTFNEGTVVTLTQVPTTGVFTAWSGDGTGTDTRSVTMSADKAVDAEWTIPDGDAPVLSNPSPSGSLMSGATSAFLSFNSDENCTCKWAITDIAYASMSAVGMTGAGTTTHTLTVSGLTAGSSYNYYFRCVDGTGNTNTSSLNISFSVPTAVLGSGSSFTLGVGGSIQIQ